MPASMNIVATTVTVTPRDPLARPQKQLALPLALLRRRQDDHLRVRDHALHVDVVLRRVHRRADEQILDVVVRAAEAEE